MNRPGNSACSRIIYTLGAALVAGLSLSSVQAQTLIEGVYTSPAGDNGRGACTLEIKSMGKSPKYGDDLYSLQSTGEGACEWTAIGLAKNFSITGGMVTSGGYTGFLALKWPFGPGGKQLNLASYNPDGSVRNSETFVRN
jgi:hypothetical protein